ncbi:hypothetical protein [Prosthecodimorpha hirschii]|uniref:hypothetical protein n=1 Tax=Prosthecodimorpha hirschii TaxID=665126 RepID=UPI0015E41A35|nr:hypothetical protein [Prosthecomicrobium hirschii]
MSPIVERAMTWWLDGLLAGMPPSLVRLVRSPGPVLVRRLAAGLEVLHPDLGGDATVIEHPALLPAPVLRLLRRHGGRLVWPSDDVPIGRFEIPPLGDVEARTVAAANMAVWTPFDVDEVLFAATARRYAERTFIDCAVLPRRNLDAAMPALGAAQPFIRDVDLGLGIATLPMQDSRPQRILRLATASLGICAFVLTLALSFVFWRDTEAETEQLRGALAKARPDIARIAALQADLGAYGLWSQAHQGVASPPSSLDLDLLALLPARLPETASIRRVAFEREPRRLVRIEIAGIDAATWEWTDDRYHILERQAGGTPALPVVTLVLTRRQGS